MFTKRNEKIKIVVLLKFSQDMVRK